MARFISYRFAAVSLVLAACTSPMKRTMPIDVDDAIAALEAETGQPWTMRVGSLGTPALLEGKTHPMAATPVDAERAARTFIGAHESLFHVSADDFAAVTATTQRDGTTHATLQQRHGSIPIWGRTLLAHFDASGALVRMNGRYGPIVAPASLEPAVASDSARTEAAILARFSRPTLDPTSITTTTPELVLYVDDTMASVEARPTRLAWHLEADGVETTDQAPLQLECLFDAESGEVLLSRDRVAQVMGSGLGVFSDRKALSVTRKSSAYWLEDADRGNDTPTRTFSNNGRVRLPGSEIRSSEADVWDVMPEHGVPGAAVDAHAYVATSWDWFLHTQDRAGFADDGVGVRTVAHYGNQFAGAFFDGKQLVFGDGGRDMLPPSAALDMVAHEYAHGVIAATAALAPDGETGAINEGLADTFACLVSYDSGQGAIWQIGEVVHRIDHHEVPLRDLADPHATEQPASVSEIVGTIDPHVDASIVGHLAYLLVEGSPFGVRPLGPDVVGHIFYRATTTYLFPSAGFAEFADALLAATRDVAPEAETEVLIGLDLVGLR